MTWIIRISKAIQFYYVHRKFSIIFLSLTRKPKFAHCNPKKKRTTANKSKEDIYLFRFHWFTFGHNKMKHDIENAWQVCRWAIAKLRCIHNRLSEPQLLESLFAFVVSAYINIEREKKKKAIGLENRYLRALICFAFLYFFFYSSSLRVNLFFRYLFFLRS